MVIEVRNQEIFDLLSSFINEMNKWEIKCSIIANDKTLTFEEQFNKQKKAVEEIFDAFCTKKERKQGRPSTISYGHDDSYIYDPEKEEIIEIYTDDKNSYKMFVETFREDPLDEKFQYILIKKEGRWLIDSKKIFDEDKNKWNNISL